MEAGS